jgi:hypothetical protein
MTTVRRTFAIGECPVGESLIGEILEPLENMQMLNGISALCPDSNSFLQTEVLKSFALLMKFKFLSRY